MRTLIRDLLLYSHASRAEISFEPTNVAAVMSDTLSRLENAIRDNEAFVTYDPLPTVMANATQMSQLLQNLVDNAVKYRSTRPPRVHVSARQQNSEWVFSIADNGIGIDLQYAEKIFIMFQRLHTREEYPGTGIGLAICKKIVERHGGRIWVESEPGKGATFFFTLPVR
jgi:chemotaxis family two-component system sensor kinase Cph1